MWNVLDKYVLTVGIIFIYLEQFSTGVILDEINICYR